MEQSIFGKNLQALRQAYGLTQKELADKLGINLYTFIGYEKTDREPRYSTLIDVADFFGVSVDDLIRQPLAVKIKIEINREPTQKSETVSVKKDFWES